jgi:hypothetical protein
MEQNRVVLNSNELEYQFHRAELPGIISEQVVLLNDLDKKVKAATKRAEAAKLSADLAAGKSAGLFQKKAAIEAIQLSQTDIAKAVVSGAEAQKIAFEFQTQLAQITKYLFGLGVTNLALNRSVVRELKLKLEGASAEEFSDLAKQEILNVIRQLKAQEDLLQKQEELDKKIKLVHDENIRQDDLLKEQNEAIIRHDQGIQAQIIEDNKFNEKIKVQAEVVNRHDTELKLQAEVDRQLAGELKAQVESYQKHKEELCALMESYKNHVELLSYLAKQEEEHNKTIVALKRDMSLSHTTISQKIMVSYMVGGIGALLAVGTLLLTSLK